MPRPRIRPDPVSCQSCRSKKLKCNRVQPCSNCSTRGVSCNFLVPPRQRADGNSTSHTNAELLARIERLESIISTQTESSESVPEHGSDGSHVRRQQPSFNPSLDSAVLSSVHRKRDEDSRWLENIGTREDSLLPCLSLGLVFRISTMYDILKAQQYPNPNLSNGQPNDTIVVFPVYSIATLLLQSYESNVDHLCQILHIPTIQSLIRASYLRIGQGESVLPGHAALLLSLFAIAAYFYRPFESSDIAATNQDAAKLSKIFSKSAFDVLDYSRRNTSGTLEDIQAYILMSFVTYHLDGFSARGRLLMTTATSIAKELRLHRLDADDEASVAESGLNARSLVDREVKRRVFWFIAATDWLFSAISGPQEGIYSIHPNHVTVRLPKACALEDIVFGEDDGPTTGTQPTGMTFFLERLRLAHLCREMADIVPLETSKLMQMPYEQIVTLDGRLQDFISSLPYFFQLDMGSRIRSKPLEAVYPELPVSRYCIITEAHSRRCKLHQKFLLRQSTDSRYVYSRRACLESARVVVQAYEDLRQPDSPPTMPEVMGMCLHYTHFALVVMAMDLCFNRDQVDETELKAEVKAALQMFETSKNTSPLTGRFLNSLHEILQKHKVTLTDPPTSATDNFVPLDAFNSLYEADQMKSTQLELGIEYPGADIDNPLDEFWQIAMHVQSNPDSLAWDNLFSALDSQRC